MQAGKAFGGGATRPEIIGKEGGGVIDKNALSEGCLRVVLEGVKGGDDGGKMNRMGCWQGWS